MKKNLSESILMNLKEEYQVKMDYNKVTDAIDRFTKQLSELGGKYFTKDFETKLCKVFAAEGGDSEKLKPFYDEYDEGPSEEMESIRLDNDILYVYSPVTVSEDDAHGIYTNFSYGFKCGIMVNFRIGAPASGPTFQLLSDMSVKEMVEEDDREALETMINILNNKEKIYSEVESIYKKYIGYIIDKANSMSTEREKDIANKQRNYANAIK